MGDLDCFRTVLSIFTIIVLCVPLILRIYVDEVESAACCVRHHAIINIAFPPWVGKVQRDVALRMPGDINEQENELEL